MKNIAKLVSVAIFALSLVLAGADEAKISWVKISIAAGEDAGGLKPVFRPIGFAQEKVFMRKINGNILTVYEIEARTTLGGHIKVKTVSDNNNRLISERLTIDKDQMPRQSYDLVLKNGEYEVNIDNPKFKQNNQVINFQKITNFYGLQGWRKEDFIIYAQPEKKIITDCLEVNKEIKFLTNSDQGVTLITAQYKGKRKIEISGERRLLREYQSEDALSKMSTTTFIDEKDEGLIQISTMPDGKGGKIYIRSERTSRELAQLSHPNALDHLPEARALMIKGAFEKRLDDIDKQEDRKKVVNANFGYWVAHKLIAVKAFKKLPKEPSAKQMIAAIDEFLKVSNSIPVFPEDKIDPKVIEGTALMKMVFRDSKTRWEKAESAPTLNFLNGFFYGYYRDWGGLALDTATRVYNAKVADDAHKKMLNDAQTRMNKIRVEMSQKYGMKFIPLF